MPYKLRMDRITCQSHVMALTCYCIHAQPYKLRMDTCQSHRFTLFINMFIVIMSARQEKLCLCVVRGNKYGQDTDLNYCNVNRH